MHKKKYTLFITTRPPESSLDKNICVQMPFFYEESTMKQKLYIHYIFYRSTKKICAIKRVVDKQSALWVRGNIQHYIQSLFIIIITVIIIISTQ